MYLVFFMCLYDVVQLSFSFVMRVAMPVVMVMLVAVMMVVVLVVAPSGEVWRW